MNEELKMFPILRIYEDRKNYPDIPKSIPWPLIEEFRVQIEKNHGQTLEGLAKRGGLSVEEIHLASEKLGLNEYSSDPSSYAVEISMIAVNELIDEFIWREDGGISRSYHRTKDLIGDPPWWKDKYDE